MIFAVRKSSSGDKTFPHYRLMKNGHRFASSHLPFRVSQVVASIVWCEEFAYFCNNNFDLIQFKAIDSIVFHLADNTIDLRQCKTATTMTKPTTARRNYHKFFFPNFFFPFKWMSIAIYSVDAVKRVQAIQATVNAILDAKQSDRPKWRRNNLTKLFCITNSSFA